MAQTTLNISGMTCEHCKRAVEGALNKLNGVTEVEVNLKASTANVTYDDGKVTALQMKQAVEEEGYKVK